MQTHYERTGKLQKKIDIYRKVKGHLAVYVASTNWSRTCREAVDCYAARTYRPPSEFFARFAK